MIKNTHLWKDFCFSVLIVHKSLWEKSAKYSNANKTFSPWRILGDFGYVFLLDILRFLIPNLLLYDFFPGQNVWRPDY